MIHLFPIRHHSPRSSATLRALLDEVRPEVVLVEGPEDADPLIPILVDGETVPPVALLGYRTEGAPQSALWPFASYSPEYAALAWAARNGARAHFVDLPTTRVLATAPPEPETPPSADERPDPHASVLAPTGHRSFEEFWEASFEAPAYQPDAFRRALVAWADLVRDRPGPRGAWHRARDAWMWAHVERVLASGVPADRVVLVAGAAHIAAMIVGDVDMATVASFAAPVPTAVTVIPYSFTRLAEQTGYGAGNRAPRYYQRAHDAGCDFPRASLEVLVEFAGELRLRGWSASLADVIEASRLATMLADLRGKSAPGLDEVREAAIATLTRGDALPVDTFLWRTVLGRAVGKVAAKVGRNSLQEEFWREVDHRRLPRQDELERFILRLQEPVQVASSVFLHRLRVADVPYASFVGVTQSVGADQEAGGVDALTRARETWEAQWTPSTDVALVERIVHGDSLVEVAGRMLRERLGNAATTGASAAILLESVVCALPLVTADALAACEDRAALDDDLPSLASACRALSGLVSFGSSRSAVAGEETLLALCTKTFDRAVSRAPSACVGDDAAMAPVRAALRTLHEIAMGQVHVDRAAWLALLETLSAASAVHPGCAGLATGLLYLAGELGDDALADRIGFRLSGGDPRDGAAFLEGFLDVNALVLCRARPVVSALDQFLQAIPADRFRDVLPLLRRAFSCLGPTERRYLLENLLDLRRLGAHAQTVAAVVSARDAAALADVAGDMAGLMDDLDDLL